MKKNSYTRKFELQYSQITHEQLNYVVKRYKNWLKLAQWEFCNCSLRFWLQSSYARAVVCSWTMQLSFPLI